MFQSENGFQFLPIDPNLNNICLRFLQYFFRYHKGIKCAFIGTRLQKNWYLHHLSSLCQTLKVSKKPDTQH